LWQQCRAILVRLVFLLILINCVEACRAMAAIMPPAKDGDGK
jgi:hypothetical protein